jgi:hypothetical protein
MERVVIFREKRKGIWLEQDWLDKASLSGELEAVILPNAILIKPRSLTSRTRGIVSPLLNENSLEELYQERTSL